VLFLNIFIKIDCLLSTLSSSLDMKQPPNVQLPPVSLEEVYVVVTAAASQDPGEIKEATDRLNDVLERPGSLDCLHEIAAQKTVALLVRQQSIIQFKNNITHWRSRR
jgi:hypothetical protein